MTNILLVCRANICRSPMALAITAQHVASAECLETVALCAAGTHAVPRRSHPDPRAMATLQRHGYTPVSQRTRAVLAQDYDRFDLILAMDRSNLADLQAQCPAAHRHKLQLFLHYASDVSEREIPDPYFGAPVGFERTLTLCEAGARGWIAHWRAA